MEENLDTLHEHRTRNGKFYLNTWGNKTTYLLSNTFRSKVMYMELAHFNKPPIPEQIAAYQKSMLQGRTGGLLLDTLIFIFFAAGLYALVKNFDEKSILALCLLFIPAFLLSALNTLPWQRYFLGMQIPYSLIAGVGVAQLVGWGMPALKRFTEGSIRKEPAS